MDINLDLILQIVMAISVVATLVLLATLRSDSMLGTTSVWGTVTVQVAVRSSAVRVTWAVPSANAVTFPLASTQAILSSLDE